MKLLLANPDRYRAGGALSPAIPQDLYKWNNDFTDMMARDVGTAEEIGGTVNDIYHLVDQYKRSEPRDLFMCCGTEDFISFEG